MSTTKSSRPALVVTLVLLLTVVAGCLAVTGSADRSLLSPLSPDSQGAEPEPQPTAVLAQGEVRPGATPGATPGVTPKPPGVDPKKPTGPFYGAQVAGPPPLADIRQDEGATVPLPDGRTLYIFADTLHLDTAPKFFASSSGAITDPADPLLLQYSKNEKGAPTEFLPREPDEKAGQVDGVRYTAIWPTGATNLPDGRTIISYGKYDLELQPRLKMTFVASGLYEFRYRDAASFARAATSRRLADDMWKIADGPVGSPVYADGHVYFTVCEDLECYSLRTTPAGLADRNSYEWKSRGGWTSQRVDRTPMLFGYSRPGHNPSVVRVDAVDAYVMADTAAGSVSFDGLLWVAPNPWGPWSVPGKFALPRCSSLGCYGLNVHAAQSTADSIRLSYSPVGMNRIGPFVYLVDQPVRVRATSNGRRISVSDDD